MGELFLQQQPIVIEDMESIRDTIPGEYAYFINSDVRGIIIVPFFSYLARGFIGIDNPKRYQDDPLTLRVLTHFLAEQLTEVKLKDENNALLGVSQYPDKMVQVKLFGQMEITARGGRLPSKALTARGKALLGLMVLNPHVHFSTMELHDILSPEEHDYEKQGVVVSNAIYKIRSKLDTIGLKELIINEDGMYFLNPEFSIDSDVEKFRQFYRDMRWESDDEEKLKKAHKALGLYVRPLPSSLCDSVRFETEAIDLQMKYLEMSQWCAETYISRKDYEKAYEVVYKAHKVDPEDGAMLLLMAKIKKDGKAPGLKTYAKRIRRHLTKEECAELDEIIK